VSAVTAYLHPKCSTCERARRWLQAHGVEFVEKDIRTAPPSTADLRTMLVALGGKRGKLFNTSGLEYRGQGLAARLPGMGDAEALGLLAGNGMLVKRPFVLGPRVGLVGFDEKAWAAALLKG
jgi:arsenate reductase (glutaredoxin)